MIDEKCLMFAVRVVNLCRFLDNEKKGWRISDQLLRSGMSIGANYAEAECDDGEELKKLFVSIIKTKRRNAGL